MAGEITGVGEKYLDRVFLGERVGQKEWEGAVVALANRVRDGVLRGVDDPAKRRAVGLICRDLTGRDDIKTQPQFDDEIEGLDASRGDSSNLKLGRECLAQATLLAMRDGGDKAAAEAVNSGSAGRIEAVLPREMVGLGREIASHVITNTEIRAVIGEVDTAAEDLVWGVVEPTQEEKLAVLNGVMVSLRKMGAKVKDGHPDRPQLELALKHLARQIKMVRGQIGGATVASSASADVQTAYYQRQVELMREVEAVSLEELLSAFIRISAPRERAPQQWEYSPPEWAGMDLEEWRKTLTFVEKYFSATYRKRSDNQPDGGYNNSVEQVSKNILNMETLRAGDFRYFYEHSRLNLRGVMHEVMADLLTPKKVVGEVYGDDGKKRRAETTIYVFKTGDGGVGHNASVGRYLANEEAYKMRLVGELVAKGVVPNRELGMMAVAAAMSILEIGGVLSLADTGRDLGFESDAVRLIQRPATKLGSKLGKEFWGGPWTEYLDAVVGKGAGKTTELLAKARDLGVLPELLAGSFLNQRVWTERGEMDLGEAIFRDIKIRFDEGRFVGDDNDMYFSWRKDQIKAAVDLWSYINNRNPLQFKTIEESDNVVTAWRVALVNSIGTLRKNGASIVPTGLVAAAIGGAVGLWPFEGPYLRLTTIKDRLRMVIYSRVGREVVEKLGLSGPEKRELLEFFGVDQAYLLDFNDKLTAYAVWLNTNSSDALREKQYRKGGPLLSPRKKK